MLHSLTNSPIKNGDYKICVKCHSTSKSLPIYVYDLGSELEKVAVLKAYLQNLTPIRQKVSER